MDKIVGRGGFGEVWKAYDPDLDRFVAVKIPRADRQFSPELLESFLAEARCVAKLRISGIVPVYDVGQEGSSYYIVSDFVDGETLADRIKRERLSWRDSALLLAEVAETLHRAHLKDLVHRDIKPANVMFELESDSVKVAAFGIALAWRLFGVSFPGLRWEGSPERVERVSARVPFLYRASLNKWWFDELNDLLFIRLGGVVASSLWWFDRRVIDGAVNGVGALAGEAGRELRRIQTGRVQNYALGIAVGLLVMAVSFLAIVGR